MAERLVESAVDATADVFLKAAPLSNSKEEVN